ncbi:MAG: hypothetical protein WDW38_005472 [Sanguina aurantia]
MVLVGLAIIACVGLGLGFAQTPDPGLPHPVARLSAIIGWTYFACWSLSFYPQVFDNFRRKSVEGLRSTRPTPPLLQTHCCRRIPQLSRTCALVVTGCVLGCGTYSAVLLFGPSDCGASIMSVLYALSYLKLSISLYKYVPQVILNHTRRSTVGWSIHNVLLDISGGLLSLLQLVMDCTAKGDWHAVTGNPVKFGLGFISLFFDAIFSVQHYVLFRDSHAEGVEISVLDKLERG